VKINHSQDEMSKKWMTDMITNKLGNLYKQLENITSDHAKLNFSVKDDIKKINTNLNIEIEQVKNENEGVLREVRRVERTIEERQVMSMSPLSDRDALMHNQTECPWSPGQNVFSSRINSPFNQT
jgi:t-SNARE complex subunit (syntaxin)